MVGPNSCGTQPTQKECYTVYRYIQKFIFYLAGTKCTLYCDHKPLAPFFTTGMSSPVLDRWALELQQFDIKFKCIQGKQNIHVVADAISRLRTLHLYRDNDNEDEPPTFDDIVENIIEKISFANSAPKKLTHNVGKLNLEVPVLKKEQRWDKFCKNKVRDIKKKPDPNFLLDHNSDLRKVIKYTIEPAIVVPRKLTSIIIIEFHNAKGQQGISRMVNMIRCYFWWIGMWRDMHQHISTCKLCIQFLLHKLYTQPLHLEIPQVPFSGCTMDCIRPLPTISKGHRHALMFIFLLTSYLITVPLKTKTADEISVAYMK